MVIGFDQLYVYARENTIYNIPTKGTPWKWWIQWANRWRIGPEAQLDVVFHGQLCVGSRIFPTWAIFSARHEVLKKYGGCGCVVGVAESWPEKGNVKYLHAVCTLSSFCVCCIIHDKMAYEQIRMGP